MGKSPTPLFPDTPGDGDSGGDGETRIIPPRNKPAPLAGLRRIGDYAIVRSLGEGGMGQVLLGRDEELDRHVAIKLIRSELAGNEVFLQRFMREARLTAQLNHPNIVQTYQAGRHEGVPYLVLEFVEGKTLRELLRTPPPMSIASILDIFIQCCDGLQAAAEKGIVHRDIKPANIMVTGTGIAKVMDFGLSKSFEADGLTITNTVLGTPEYMSPEQSAGGDVDFRTDIYALGISLFQCVTGYLPFSGSSVVDTMMRHAQEPLPDDPNLAAMANGRMKSLVAAMTAKKPAGRPASYNRVKTELESIREMMGSRAEAMTTMVKLDPVTGPGSGGSAKAESSTAARPKSRASSVSRAGRTARAAMLLGIAIGALAGLTVGGLHLAGAFDRPAALPIAPAAADQQVVPPPADAPVLLTYRSNAPEPPGRLLDALKAVGLNIVMAGTTDPTPVLITASFQDADPDEVLLVLSMIAGWALEFRAGIAYLSSAREPATFPDAPQPEYRATVDTMRGNVTLREMCEALRSQTGLNYIMVGETLPRLVVARFSLTRQPLDRILEIAIPSEAGTPAVRWRVSRGVLVLWQDPAQ